MNEQREQLVRSVRGFLRARRYGVLATMSLELPGHPFGSITPYVVTHEGRVILLVSAIAQHTKNMIADPKVSILVADETSDDKQAAGRVTVVGQARRVGDDAVEAVGARYLRGFPSHRDYDQAHDFHYVEIDPVRIRFIGGFGEIHWIERDEWILKAPGWAADEHGIIEHVNSDHQGALEAMCRRFLDLDGSDASMINLDAEGFHVKTSIGVHYIPFETSCDTSQEVRTEMVRLAHEARTAAGS